MTSCLVLIHKEISLTFFQYLYPFETLYAHINYKILKLVLCRVHLPALSVMCRYKSQNAFKYIKIQVITLPLFYGK